jgi:hypothetical protein
MLQEKLNSSERGFSLLETMIAGAVFATLIGTVTIFIKNSNSQLYQKRARMEQERISQSIKIDLRDMKRVEASVASATSGNELLLRRCLESNKAGTLDCKGATDASNQRPFTFMSRRGGPASPFVKKGGTPGSPATYSLFGAPNCTAGTAYCPFWNVETYFWATCSGGKAECDKATAVHVRYIVKPVRAKYEGQDLVAIPDLNEFNSFKSRFAISHSIATPSKLEEDKLCPAGSQLSGSKSGGELKCVCRGGFNNVEPDPNKMPKCIASAPACPPGQRIKGRKQDGTVYCVKQVKQCRTVTFDKDDGDTSSTSSAATCPIGGWLENINLGRCKAAPKNKKGTDRGIKCDTNQGRCCFYDEQ